MLTSYKVTPRRDSPICDVHAREDGGKTRLVNTFNHEADAWQWVTEQEQAQAMCERMEKSGLVRR